VSTQGERTFRALNILTKWRTIFAGWQLGTRPKGDPECDAVRDHRELSMILRAEVTAFTGLLREKGVFTDGCTLYQPLDGLHPAAVWLSEGADPDPRQYRALYAADWPGGADGS
jgi:hypothetical protein